ncbi:hypothetical protein IL252_13115 [Halomicrobium sp. IBSBa]|uniref:hypothetical protein n=1 Tax=Halomicrobium sp. IBSBa TaxID=2778916 RepID=UPI001ABF8B1E|nr:hypothetical protein [Halomicrobium sp. IBSBa]MBO4248757.1 hypothetical protein [Halomicrobium sp. IBSBa]
MARISDPDRRHIGTFTVIALALSGLVGGVLYATGGLESSPELLPGVTLATMLLPTLYMFSPAVANVATRLLTDEGWNDLRLSCSQRSSSCSASACSLIPCSSGYTTGKSSTRWAASKRLRRLRHRPTTEISTSVRQRSEHHSRKSVESGRRAAVTVLKDHRHIVHEGTTDRYTTGHADVFWGLESILILPAVHL